MDLFETQKPNSFELESNYMKDGRGYHFHAKGDVEGIINKYKAASSEFKNDLDGVMKRWLELLTPEEIAMISVDEKRTFRAVSEYKSLEEVVDAGGFSQLTRKE